MKRKQIIQFMILLGMGYGFVMSCTYDEVLPFAPNPGDEVLFNEDILPIFQSNCNGAGCHNGSGPSPDLRAAGAYDALWTGGYINVEVPEQSELYLWMTDAKGPMPPLGANAINNALVLQWIQQGAENN
jgi:hypothetical protein